VLIYDEFGKMARKLRSDVSIVILFGTSLSKYALLNAPGSATNDFDAE
jgi:hypothetical protein